MGTDVSNCKNLWFCSWLQLDSNQLVNFPYTSSFGTVRSVVRIHWSRPLESSTYGYLQRWRYFICGQFVRFLFWVTAANFFTDKELRCDSRDGTEAGGGGKLSPLTNQTFPSKWFFWGCCMCRLKSRLALAWICRQRRAISPGRTSCLFRRQCWYIY